MAILKPKVVRIFYTRYHNFTMLKTQKFPFKLFYEKQLKEKKNEHQKRNNDL